MALFRLCPVLLAVLACLAPAAARAQFVPGAQPPVIPSAPPPPPPGYVPPAYGVYPGAVAYGNVNPYGGYFNGVASLTQATGQYYQDVNNARMTNQKVEQEKIRTRQMLNDQSRYEQSLQPTTEELEQKKRALELRRALNDPPLPEILNGDALNTLLKSFQFMHTRGSFGPTVPLDQAMLAHIRVSGSGGGSVAAIQSKKIRWPLVMRDTPYDADRKKFQQLTDTATAQLIDDNLQLSTIRDMEATVDNMSTTLNSQGSNMGLQDIITAQRQLEELRDSIRALKSPQAGNYFNKKWAAKGDDVRALVLNMTQDGLRFAPGLEGDEGAYQVLYRAMVSYSYGANQARK